MRAKQLASVIVTVAVLTCWRLEAATNYVAIHTGGTYDGQSWATAYTNIQDALDATTGPNVILVAGESFLLTEQLVISNSYVTLRGGYEGVGSPGANDPEKWPTEIRRNPAVATRLLFMEAVAETCLEGIVFRDGLQSDPHHGGAIYANHVTNLVVHACRFYENEARAIDSDFALGGALYASGSGEITDTVFNSNYANATGNWRHHGRGGAAWLSGDWNLTSVVAVNNRAAAHSHRTSLGAGLYLEDGEFRLHNLLVVNNHLGTANPSGAGIYSAATASLDVSNMTLAYNWPVGIGFYHAGPAEIRNSILYGNQPTDVRTDNPPVLSHCLVGDGTGDGQNGNFAADPLFEQPLYYLDPECPGVNMGDRSAMDAGLDDLTTFTNGVTDSGTVNLGFHFARGTTPDRILFVAVDGDDSHSGEDWNTALRSITGALKLAGNRTHIHIGSGIYTNGVEEFPLRNEGKDIRFVGAGAGETIIDASGTGSRVFEIRDTLGDCRIASLTVTGGYHQVSGAGIRVDRSFITLTDIEVTGNILLQSGSDHLGAGLAAAFSAGVIYEGNFTGNTAGATAGMHWSTRGFGGGMNLHGGYWDISRTVISRNIAAASTHETHGRARGAGAYINVGRLRLRNVLIDRNVSAETSGVPHSGGLLVYANTLATLDNCTLADNWPEGLRGGSKTFVTNSIFWGNQVDSTGGVTIAWSTFENSTDHVDGGNNIVTDPLFLDADDGDYRLQSGSPAINSGLNLPWMVDALDLQGVPRILKGRVDMGAYEYIPPAGSLFMIF